MTLVSKAGLPPKDIAEIVAWMKANQGKATYGHAGIGSASHLCMLMLMKELGIKMEGVGYRGTGPAMNDLISGTFDVMCDQTTNTTGHIKDGRIKGYAVTTKAKVSSVPGLPTFDSGTLPGFEVSAWHALWAPKGLPKDVTDKLVAALKVALKDPKVVERFASLGTEPVAETQVSPEALKAYLEAEVKRWGAVIKAAGVKGKQLIRRALMKTYKIAAIPGDGIGTEVVSAGVEVLEAIAKRDGSFAFQIDHFDWGGDYYKKHGRMMPEDGARADRAGTMRSCSARPAIPTFPTTSRCGACGWRSASRSTSTPTCARRACCRASPRRCAT